MVDSFGKKIYACVVTGFLPLSIYYSGISSLSLGDVLVLLGFILLFFISIKNEDPLIGNSFFIFCPFLIYVFFSCILADSADVFLRTIRFLTYLSFVAIFSQTYFDLSITMKVYGKICLFATVFIILQYLSYNFFHFYIPGYVSFIPKMDDTLILYSEKMLDVFSYDQRMRSIFNEPAHYAAYVSVFIAMSVFLIKKVDFLTILCGIGILISSSSTGVFLLFFVFISKIVEKIFVGFSTKSIFVGVFVLFIVLFLLPKFDFIQTFLFRMEEGRSFAGRFDGYDIMMERFKSLKDYFWGFGMLNLNYYLAGWARLFFCFGAFGVALYCFPLFFKTKGNLKNMELLMFYFLMGTGTLIYLSGSSMLILSYLMNPEKNGSNEYAWKNC